MLRIRRKAMRIRDTCVPGGETPPLRYPRKVVRIRRGVVQIRKFLLHTSSVTFGDSFSSRRSLGAVPRRCDSGMLRLKTRGGFFAPSQSKIKDFCQLSHRESQGRCRASAINPNLKWTVVRKSPGFESRGIFFSRSSAAVCCTGGYTGGSIFPSGAAAAGGCPAPRSCPWTAK